MIIDNLLLRKLFVNMHCLPASMQYRGWLGQSWNNGKEVPRLDLTISSTPGQQICVIGCAHIALVSQLLRDSFSVSQKPPIWEPPSHYSMGSVHVGAELMDNQLPRRWSGLLSLYKWYHGWYWWYLSPGAAPASIINIWDNYSIMIFIVLWSSGKELGGPGHRQHTRQMVARGRPDQVQGCSRNCSEL